MLGRHYCNVPIEGGCTLGPGLAPKSYANKTKGDNLLAHLEDDHDFDEIKMLEALKKKGGTMHSFLKPMLAPVEEATVRFIAGTDQPPSILDSDELHEWIDALRKTPTYTPSRRKFARALKRMANNEEDRVRLVLRKSHACSLSFDIWSKFGVSYLAVNAHCITESWQPDHFLLGLVEFGERHTGTNIASMMLALVKRFIAVDTIVGVTSDSASNNTSKGFVKETSWLIRVLCAAHKASNASKAIFREHSEAKRLLDRAKRVVKLIRRSPLTAKIFNTYQRKLKPYVAKRLPTLGETRFNAGYILLGPVSEHRNAIKLTQEHLKKDTKNKATWSLIKDSVLQDTDWDVLDDLLPVLETFNHFVVAVQDRRILLSDLLLKVWNTRDALAARAKTTSFAGTLKEAVDRYFAGIFSPTSVYVLCAAIDPRSKNLNWLSPAMVSKTQSQSVLRTRGTLGVEADLREDVWAHIKNEALAVYQSFFEKEPPVDQASSAVANALDNRSESTTIANDMSSVLAASTSAFFGESGPEVSHGPTDAPNKAAQELVQAEITSFRQLAQQDKNTDPFQWWGNQTRFPVLKKLAARLFSLQATEVENERDFSHTGLSINLLISLLS